MRVEKLMAVVATGIVLTCGSVACGGDDGANAPNDQSVQGTVVNSVISVPVSVDGRSALPFVVDTGSPLTRLDPARYMNLGIDPGFGQITTLDVGDVHLTNVDVVVATLCGIMMMCQGTEPAGLLGAETLLTMPFTMNYRRGEVTFGDVTLPAGVGPPVMTPFALEGGGDIVASGDVMTVPATRIAITVDIEGVAVPMVLDTGSSAVVLAPDLYDALIKDGRTQTTVEVFTIAGTQNVSATTLGSVSLAGATQSNIQAMRAPVPLDLLEREVGHRVQGLLGGAYLRNYLTTIDYPARLITLRSN